LEQKPAISEQKFNLSTEKCAQLEFLNIAYLIQSESCRFIRPGQVSGQAQRQNAWFSHAQHMENGQRI